MTTPRHNARVNTHSNRVNALPRTEILATESVFGRSAEGRSLPSLSAVLVVVLVLIRLIGGS